MSDWSALEFIEPTSAGRAKYRLREILLADRQACGDGRWVRSFFLDMAIGIAIVNAVNAGLSEFESLLKPHYRWEPRR